LENPKIGLSAKHCFNPRIINNSSHIMGNIKDLSTINSVS
jgi:hypothetical protein